MAGRNGATPTGNPKAPRAPNAAPSTPEHVTIKQQRAARTAQKLAKFKRQQVRAKHRRLLIIVAGCVAAVATAALLVVVAVTSGTPKTAPAAVQGVRTFPGLAATHVSGPVDYPQTPPMGGPHAPVWLNCAVYSQPVPNENAVHSLEHGSVWVTYDPGRITGDQLTALRKDIPTTYAILSPYKGLPSPIVASAWGVQLQVSRVEDPRIAGFIAKYREAKSAPEPGAPCTGGIDGPGRVS